MSDNALNQFYLSLERLSAGLGGGRTLTDIRRSQGWPDRGVYFFFERGETRPSMPHQPRVVRVGTHGLHVGARSTLYGRLRQHRRLNNGGGNHRGSVFRKHAGTALLARYGTSRCCPSWGVGNHVDPITRGAEQWIECEVSWYLGSMSLLWIDIDDEPGPQSDRGFIERNAVGLLASREAASANWLGRNAAHPIIQTSNLWNVNHVQHVVEDGFLERLSRLVDSTIGRHLRL